jgi:hypothetical protein
MSKKICQKIRVERHIKTLYRGLHGERTAHSCTLEGALRPALIRIVHGDYIEAQIFDNRFGETDGPAILVDRTTPGAVKIRWAPAVKWGIK